MEENVVSGGMGEHIGKYISEHDLALKQYVVAIPDVYVEHGNVSILKKDVGIDADTIYEKVLHMYEQMK
jgi:1-deoxy-D-xylulose-5-phosphate synthase